MTNPTPKATHLCYRIRVRGHLPPDWGDWFDGFSLAHTADDATLLTSPLLDQAALHGALATIRDLGLFLEAVIPIPSETPGPPRNGG
ncbi:hypothetical protein [Candidatus Chloroploca asiatica]|uniref:Uncharacterized protein n=1 Tax=Candidatus Chloroploca asiatica TaxID=1506545 RepID=A0A2H3KPV6_9CHLR|nr:hypothetical protein [Candidatus Chloroploca asiatica]PDW00237.1 hypothetical protein A9Q02_10480 [Candidatus Chloroploca asiatica]